MHAYFMINFVYNDGVNSLKLLNVLLQFMNDFYFVNIFFQRNYLVVRGNSVKQSEDAELIARIYQDDDEALILLTQKYYQWLLVIVQIRFPQSQFHEDVVHDTFLTAVDAIKQKKIKDAKKFKSFLRSCAINIAHEYYRKDKRYQSDVSNEWLDQLESTTSDLFEQYDFDKKKLLAQKMLECMTMERDQLILKYHYFEGWKKADVCQQLDLSPDQFDKVIYRAKLRLKALVDADRRNNKTYTNSIQKLMTFLPFIMLITMVLK